MADVTDAPFRQVIAKYGKPDVMWTEFVAADGLVHADEEGKKRLMQDFIYTEAERPIVAQLFTGKSDEMRQAAALVRELGFDGIDINMGCPDRKIEKQGAGASLCKEPERARELIRAAREGVENKIPVSVKIRLGYNTDILEEWLPELLAENPTVVTIHCRTRKEMSKVPARWDRIARAVEIRDELRSDTLIIGNGDVSDVPAAHKRVEETGCDGVMIGRGIFGNPWCFDPESNYGADVSVEQKLRVMVEHTRAFEEILPEKNFAIMKKHYKAYVNDFPGAKELRVALMEAQTAGEVEVLVEEFLA